MKKAASRTSLQDRGRVKRAKGAPSKLAAGAADSRNAGSDAGRQGENRRSMGVGPDHKTDTMRSRKRGTFP